jgi:alpha-beta hydrolase superfamily lysophospholipase
MTDALYFDSGKHRLFGWIHKPPPGRSTDSAVVVCKPFGYEAICSHRGVRAFADAAASLGLPTLRFDYTGTGDSSEIDPAADQLEIWTSDVVAAVHEVRRLTGARRIYLLGFRLGALLAMLASARCDAIAGLVLVAPIVNGRRFVRELRTMRLAATMGAEPYRDSGVMEVSGFVLSAATIQALGNVDLKSPKLPPGAEMLVIDGSSMPLARVWSEELSRSGLSASYRSLPGLVEMLMTAPQFAGIPTEMISAMREWFTQRKDGTAPEPGNVAYQDSMTLAIPAFPHGAPVRERALHLPPDAVLFGIVTEPAINESPRGAVILINAGADYHIGASGIYVLLARRWAQLGYAVLRLDLAGLGDSQTRVGRPDNEVFPPGAQEDIRAAIEWVRGQYGAIEVTLGGFCSGAFHVLQAAIGSIPVNRAIMVNAETYFWTESQSIHDRQTAELVHQPEAYGKQLLSVQSWKRLLRGQIDIRYVLGTYSRSFWLALESGARNIARRLRIPLPNDLGTQLEAAVARGVRLLFVFSRGEPGLNLLKLQAGVSLERLGKRCEVRIVDNADHVFSKLDSRRTVEKILTDELTSPQR